ncbi:MAG: hypothetical protein EBU36_07330, partial [Verrucomicrobia bacterium]|nr:hypothetical protein [Verrucomicrobiota bacterium]
DSSGNPYGPSTTPPTHPGSYVIKGVLAGDANYESRETTANFTIQKLPVTVTADPKEKTYGDTDPGLTYVSSDLGATFVGTLARGSGESVGTYAIGQGSLDNPNYSITYVSANLTIQPKALTVTAEAKSKMYGQVDPALTYTSSGLIGTDALSGSLTRDSGQDIGSYEIRQGTLTAGENYTIYFTGAQLVIDPLDNSSITITPGTYTYNKLGQGPGVGQTSTSGSTGGVTYTYEGTDNQGNPYGPTSTPPTLPGSYKVKGELAADSNHKGAETTVNFIISPKPITITADAKSKVYGQNDPALTYQITSGTLESGDSLSGSLSRESGENVGTHAISSTLANSNYEITYQGALLTIIRGSLPAPLLNLSQNTVMYGDCLPLPGLLDAQQFYNDVKKVIPDAFLTFEIGDIASDLISVNSVQGGKYNYNFSLGVKIIPAVKGEGFIGDLTAYLRHEWQDGNQNTMAEQTRLLIDQVGLSGRNPPITDAGLPANGMNVVFSDYASRNIQSAGVEDLNQDFILEGTWQPASLTGSGSTSGTLNSMGGDAGYWNGS